MFGTFEAERSDVKLVYGLVDQPQFWNPVQHQVRMVSYTFSICFHSSKRSNCLLHPLCQPMKREAMSSASFSPSTHLTSITVTMKKIIQGSWLTRYRSHSWAVTSTSQSGEQMLLTSWTRTERQTFCHKAAEPGQRKVLESNFEAI